MTRVASLLALLALPVVAAAAPPWRVHPDYAARMAGVRTVAIVAPEVKAWELTANGTATLRPDRVELVSGNVAAGLEAALRRRRLSVKRLPVAESGELREVGLLHDAVRAAILEATYVHQFPWKVGRFEYTLGDLSSLAAAEGVDAFVFAYGAAGNSTGGRLVINALVGGSVPLDRLFVTLVDRTGTVLWFGEHHDADSDLLRTGSAVGFVENLLEPLPRVEGKR